MSTTFPWLTAMVVTPVVGAALLWALPSAVRRSARIVALAFSLLTLALGVCAAIAFDTGDAATYQLIQTARWIPAIGASWAVGVNGVGLALIGLSVVLVPVVIIAAWREHGGDEPDGGRLRHYLALILVLEAFMVLVFAARDVFLFYVVFEAMLIPVYFMIGSFGGPQRRYAAVKFLLYSLAGGLIMLAAVIVLFLHGPRGDDGFLITNLAGIHLSVNTGRWLFAGFFIAFAIKAPMVPVHTWLPDAAEQAPAGTSALLVGVLDKVGTFGMLSLCLPLFPEAAHWAAPGIVIAAVVSVIYGGLLAIGQRDIMRMIAFTSISHFGFMVLGIFAFTTTSVAGASFYMVNHGLSTGALFLVAGYLVARRGSQQLSDFGGLAKVTPVLAGLFLVSGLSALSLPGLSTFVSEFMVLVGSFTRHPAVTIVAVFGVVLAALYVLLTYQKVFTGPVLDGLADTKDVSWRERAAIAPLIALMLVLGFFPGPIVNLVKAPATTSIEQVGETDPVPESPALDTTAAAEGSHR